MRIEKARKKKRIANRLRKFNYESNKREAPATLRSTLNLKIFDSILRNQCSLNFEKDRSNESLDRNFLG